MFIAMELSSEDTPWRYFPSNSFKAYLSKILSSDRSCSHIKSLEREVNQQLEHIHRWSLKIFARDFDIDTALISESEQKPPLSELEHTSAKVLKLLQDLHTNLTSEPEQKPPLVHSPRHDAESVFWLLWFLLARANPQSQAPGENSSAEKKDYDAFCSVMLNHTVGAPFETREVLAGMSIERYRQTLHPCFAHLGDMVYHMGRYFLIDPETWRDYDEDHAYHFMECLLLGEMHRNEGLRNLPLDITQPRPATETMALVRRFAVPVESRSWHNYASSLTQDNAVSCSSSSSGLKQKPDTDPQGSPFPKRHCTGPVQLRRSSRRSSHQDHAAPAGAPQTGIQPEIVRPARNPLFPTPDRAEANEEVGRATEDENQGKFLDPDVEEANYVASQETLETKEQLEQEAFNQWSKFNRSLLQAFDAAKDIQVSMLRGKQWFTMFTE